MAHVNDDDECIHLITPASACTICSGKSGPRRHHRSTDSREGWQEQLPIADRQDLDNFERWLIGTEGKTAGTAADYRSHVAQFIVRMRRGESWDDMESRVHSAVRAFRRWMDQRSR